MSQTALKIIALICMTLDHIATFIPGAPEWLHLIGRVSAPIFIFCLVVGFDKTRSRRQMLLRLYILSVAMAVLNAASNLWLFDGFTVENNVFQTLFCILLLIQLMSESRKKTGLYLAASFVIAVPMLLNSTAHFYPDVLTPVLSAVIGNPFLAEGNFIIVLLGLLIHRFYQDKRKLSISLMIYFAFQFITSQLFLFTIILRLFTRVLFDASRIEQFISALTEMTLGIQMFPPGISTVYSTAWIGIFALPLFLLYNGQRGRGLKKFFYIYYPAHIYLLAFLRLIIGEPPIPDDFVDILGE